MLPVALIGGAVFYKWMGYLTFLSPYLIFAMLFITYCRLELKEFKFGKFQVILLAVQMALAAAVYFFLLGAFFGIRKIDFVAVARRVELPVYVLSVCLGVAMMLTYRTAIFSSLMLCFRIAGAFAAFALASHILSVISRRLPRLVVQASYFIYLAHYVFFLSFIDTAFFHFFGISTAAYSIHYLLCPLIKVALLVGVYIVYDKILTLYRK